MIIFDLVVVTCVCSIRPLLLCIPHAIELHIFSAFALLTFLLYKNLRGIRCCRIFLAYVSMFDVSQCVCVIVCFCQSNLLCERCSPLSHFLLLSLLTHSNNYDVSVLSSIACAHILLLSSWKYRLPKFETRSWFSFCQRLGQLDANWAGNGTAVDTHSSPLFPRVSRKTKPHHERRLCNLN